MAATLDQSTTKLDSAQRAWLKKMGVVFNMQVPDDASVDGQQKVTNLTGDVATAAPSGPNDPPKKGKGAPNKSAPAQSAPGNQGSDVAAVGVPRRPMYAGGEVLYEGTPLKKLDARQQNLMRANAKTVRDKIKVLDGWALRVDAEAKKHAKQRDVYDSKVFNIQGVQAAFEKDKEQTFRKLSRKSGQELGKGLKEYENASSRVSENVKLLEGKAWRLAAADALARKAEMLIEAHNLQKDRADASKEKAALEEKLNDLKGVAGKIVDAAKDPLGTAKKIGIDIAEGFVQEILVDIMGGGKIQQRIKQVEARIKNIDQRLDQLGIGALKADLTAAISTISAIQSESDSVREALDRAKREQGGGIDHLADIEKDNPNTTTMFRELQKFYKAVEPAAKKTLDSSREYEKVMIDANGARRATAEIRNTVRQDMALMTKLYTDWTDPEVLVHQDKAQAIIDYTNRVDEWYVVQVDQALESQRQLQKDLMRNGQLDFIAPMINDAQKYGLSHVQDDANMTK